MNLIALASHITFRLNGGGNGAWFDYAEQCVFDRVIVPQPTESNATGLAIIELTTPARIARNVMIASGVPYRQLPTASLATEKAGKQSIAMLWRSMMRLAGILSLTILRIPSARSQLM